MHYRTDKFKHLNTSFKLKCKGDSLRLKAQGDQIDIYKKKITLNIDGHQ